MIIAESVHDYYDHLNINDNNWMFIRYTQKYWEPKKEKTEKHK